MSKLFNVFQEHEWNYNDIPFLLRQALINEFLYEITKIYDLRPIKPKDLHNLIMEILLYINQHYNENFTLESLASRYNYSPKYFSELFNKNVGCNLTTYINNVRIDKALLQLNDPNNKESITSVAFAHGFNSLATFYRALQRKRGQQK